MCIFFNHQIDNVGLERMLRYQASMGYSLLFSNALFLALVLFFQFYMFRAFDKRLYVGRVMVCALGVNSSETQGRGDEETTQSVGLWGCTELWQRSHF